MIKTFTRHRGRLILGLLALIAFKSFVAAQVDEIATPAGPTLLASPIVQTYYVPLSESHLQTAFQAIDTTGVPVGNSFRTIITVVVPTASTVVTYDHWEDGFEIDPASPIQSTTQVWGDGLVSNGNPADYLTDDFAAGTVITLSNRINLPRNADAFAFDGRDRICSTKAIVVSRVCWATTPGTVLASATEVYDTQKWGTSFTIPVGVSSSAEALFEYSSLHIIAAQDGTVVDVDVDHNGSVDQTQTLSTGESMFVNGNVQPGATVVSSLPIEVHELTGDIDSAYESRTFAILPTSLWASEYFAPASTTLAAETSNVFLFNPGASAITVNYATTASSGSFSVAAGANYSFAMPMNSGAHFASTGGAPFYAVGTSDSGDTALFNNSHEWGYALLPATMLTTEVAVGYAPGAGDKESPVGPDQNGSPVWVTATAGTTLYVNYTGDYTIGQFTASNGRKYDAAVPAALLESVRLYDPGDKDMTKALIFTTDGTAIAAAWGEDATAAGPGSPFLDVGTSILPFTSP